MKLYVTGPMTGIEYLNFPTFNAATKLLRELGYEVSNPADNGGGAPGLAWEDYMRIDLLEMLRCEGLALLPGWESSRGSCLEVYLAENLSWPVKTVEEWIKDGLV